MGKQRERSRAMDKKTESLIAQCSSMNNEEPVNIVYINQDHPLYQNVYKKRELFKLHLFRLITQEIVLMKKLKITASDAFKFQSKLLTDAVVEK